MVSITGNGQCEHIHDTYLSICIMAMHICQTPGAMAGHPLGALPLEPGALDAHPTLSLYTPRAHTRHNSLTRHSPDTPMSSPNTTTHTPMRTHLTISTYSTHIHALTKHTPAYLPEYTCTHTSTPDNSRQTPTLPTYRWQDSEMHASPLH